MVDAHAACHAVRAHVEHSQDWSPSRGWPQLAAAYSATQVLSRHAFLDAIFSACREILHQRYRCPSHIPCTEHVRVRVRVPCAHVRGLSLARGCTGVQDCVHVRTRVSAYAHVRVCARWHVVRTRAPAFVHARVCTHVHTCTHTHTPTQAHTHNCTQA